MTCRAMVMATAVETMHDGWPALIRQQWRMQMLWGAFCCAPCGYSCLALSRMQAALTKVGGGSSLRPLPRQGGSSLRPLPRQGGQASAVRASGCAESFLTATPATIHLEQPKRHCRRPNQNSPSGRPLRPSCACPHWKGLPPSARNWGSLAMPCDLPRPSSNPPRMSRSSCLCTRRLGCPRAY